MYLKKEEKVYLSSGVWAKRFIQICEACMYKLLTQVLKDYLCKKRKRNLLVYVLKKEEKNFTI